MWLRRTAAGGWYCAATPDYIQSKQCSICAGSRVKVAFREDLVRRCRDGEHHARPRGPAPRTAAGELTSRQSAIARYTTESVARKGCPPSMRKIGQAVELASTSSVAHQVMALERKGVLYRDPYRRRAYRVRPSWAPDLGNRSERPVDVPLSRRSGRPASPPHQSCGTQ